MFKINFIDGLYFVFKGDDKVSIGFEDEKMAQDEIKNLSKDCECPFRDKMFTQSISFTDNSSNAEKRTVISIRDGVQEYLGAELGIEPFDKVFKIYRSPETIRELKDKLNGLPLIENHIEPEGEISEDLKRGKILDSQEVVNVDKDLDSTIAIKNEISLFKDKLEFEYKQLSLGYKATTLPSAKYDFEQSNIIPHHLGIVEAGRCGDTCSFQDKKGVKRMNLEELMAKLKEFLDSSSDEDKANLVKALDEMFPKQETKDNEADLEKKFEDAKSDAIAKFMDSKVFKDAMLNYGNERASVIAKATNYLDSNYDFKSKSNEAIMSDVVKAEYPNETFKDAEIGVAFKMLKQKEAVSHSVIDFKDAKDEISKAFNEELK